MFLLTVSVLEAWSQNKKTHILVV